jgi:GNAT superfamily N-acetyltransferase
MPLVVRIAEPSDGSVAKTITGAAFAAARAAYRPNPAALANLSAIAPKLERLVAKMDGLVVGTVRYGVFDRSLRVIGLAVLPDRQRQGIARKLIEALADIAADRECQTLSLYTVVQTGNVPIFQRLGFQVVSESPDAYSISVSGEPLTEAFMERPVTR